MSAPAKVSLISGLVLLALAAACPATAGAPCPPPENPWNCALGLTLRESYDTNVFLQDLDVFPEALAAIRAAGYPPAEPLLASWVTSIQPKLELTSTSADGLAVTAAYAPEIVFYHSADEENYVAHRATLTISGSREKTVWEWATAATYVDGSELGSFFPRPGDVPAIGAVPIHERMEQFFTRDSFKLTLPAAHGFVRPVAAFYYHDFRGTQLRSGPGYVYENHVDRSEFSAGLDLGWKTWEKTALVLGYRYGAQSQYRLFGVDSPYDNRFHRILFGIEGEPRDWLKVGVLAGPDIRSFGAGTPAGFDPGESLYFLDGKVTLLPTGSDSLTLLARRLEQPATSSQSMYEDIVYEANWKHRFDDHWAASAGFRAYGGDWQAPVEREDWIYTPSAALLYTRDAGFSAELGYSHDWADNLAGAVPGTPTAYAEGREFTRNIVWLSGKYSF